MKLPLIYFHLLLTTGGRDLEGPRFHLASALSISAASGSSEMFRRSAIFSFRSSRSHQCVFNYCTVPTYLHEPVQFLRILGFRNCILDVVHLMGVVRQTLAAGIVLALWPRLLLLLLLGPPQVNLRTGVSVLLSLLLLLLLLQLLLLLIFGGHFDRALSSPLLLFLSRRRRVSCGHRGGLKQP